MQNDDATSPPGESWKFHNFTLIAIPVAWISAFVVAFILVITLGSLWRFSPGGFDFSFIATIGLLLIAGFFLIPGMDVRPSLKAAIAAAAGGVLFALALIAKWQGGITSDVMVGGLLPASDATGYFSGALNFLHQGVLHEWATRRPLTSLQLASLLSLGGGSLRFAVGVLMGRWAEP
jgi:hypothetical protein